MTHKKILFTDLDGTLLRNDKSISSFTRDTIKRWTESGNYFELSSGRDLNSTLKVKEDLQLNFQNVFAIGYNGGQIFDCTKNETIYKITLKIEQVEYLYKKAKEAGIYVHTYSDKNIIVAEKTKETEFYTRVIKTPVLVSKDLKLTEPPCKAIIINLDDKEKLENFRLSLLPWAEENDLSILYSNPWYVEIFPKKSGKGNAVKKLVDLIGIP